MAVPDEDVTAVEGKGEAGDEELLDGNRADGFELHSSE